MSKDKAYTASDLTKYAIKYLSMCGYNVWRQNQVKVPGRAFTGKKGLSDVIGFSVKNGHATFIAIEVKAAKDKMSEEQSLFQHEVEEAGGIFIVMRKPEDLDTLNKKKIA